MSRLLFLSQGPSKLISESDDYIQHCFSKYDPSAEALVSIENELMIRNSGGGTQQFVLISPSDNSDAG